MERAIEAAKRIIYKEIKNYLFMHFNGFSEYGKLYLFTNENINSYINQNKFNPNDKALSILSSGDHVLNLATNGIKDIDTFDINYLTEYYALGLKIALITKYSYEDFLLISQMILNRIGPPEPIAQIIFDIIPYMDEKYRKFWYEITDFYIKTTKEFNCQINLFNILRVPSVSTFNPEILPEINTYLTNKENYETLRSNLVRTNISFRQADIYYLAEKFKEKSNNYNYIFLSNVLDYVYSNRFGFLNEKNLKKIIKPLAGLMQDDGLIYMHYVFNPDVKLFKKSFIQPDFFEEDQVLNIKGFNKAENLVLLKRVENGEIQWKKQ